MSTFIELTVVATRHRHKCEFSQPSPVVRSGCLSLDFPMSDPRDVIFDMRVSRGNRDRYVGRVHSFSVLRSGRADRI